MHTYTTDSDGMGRESCVYFMPPSSDTLLKDRKAPITNDKSWGTTGETKHTVLVINDTPDQLELMSILLRQSGYEVLIARDGREGYEVALAHPPDLIISDVSMPRLDGIELCRLVREHPKLNAIPLLLVSALRKDSESAVEGLQAGADDYLETPCDPMRLVAKVARLTERKRAEEVSRQREKYFRLLIENSTDNIAVLSEDGSTLYDSPSIERLTGYKPEEMVGRNNFGLIHADDIERVMDAFKEGLQRDEIGPPVEYRHRHKDGSWRVLESVGKRFLDESGQVLAIINTRDITERKLAEEKLKRREAQLAETQRLAHIGSFEWDLATDRWTWSDELYRIFGLEPQSVIVNEDLFSRHLIEEERKAVMEMFGQAILDHQPFLCEHSVVHADGATRILQVRGQAVVDQSGASIKVIGTSQDITELKHSEEALGHSKEQFLQSQKMEAIGQLAGGVAHDFNNLLTVITGYSNLALSKLNPVDPLCFYLEEIKKASDRAASLTCQLLAFSRRQVLQPRVLDLNAIVADLAKMLSRLIGENIKLKTVLAPELGSVKADPGQVEQVILNLAVNARDAMPQGGRLTIETHNIRLDDEYVGIHLGAAPGDYVMIAVSDTGCGMDEKTRERIFEPFFTTKEVGKGTGLGLSTVYGIVKQSGGSIWVYSEMGKGTTFKVYLPRIDEEPQEYHRGTEEREIARGTETILLVEDEEMLRRLAREVLEMKGYRVLEAANGGEAIRLCEEYRGRIHLLLTDVVMPEMSGRALADQLLQARPDLLVLYMSGYTADAIVNHGVVDEGTLLIQKPFTPGALAQMVREVLESAGK